MLQYIGIIAQNINPKHLTKDGQLKPRRPLPHVMESDFFDSIVETDDGRFIFSGILIRYSYYD